MIGDGPRLSDREAFLSGEGESNMLKSLPKMLPGISQKFHLLCFSVFLLCLHYAPNF